jgi:hypothetical protein
MSDNCNGNIPEKEPNGIDNDGNPIVYGIGGGTTPAIPDGWRSVKDEIEKRIAEIESDDRFKRKPASIVVNAPLALIQMGLKGEFDALKYCLSLLPTPPDRREG